MNDFQYLTAETDEESLYWITIATQDTESDSIPVPLLQELKQSLSEIATNSALKGLIIQAAATTHKSTRHKSTSTAAGPTKTSSPTPEVLLTTVKLAQETFQLLTTLRLPSVVLLDGLKPVYGMPLAMAASYCLAADNDANTLSFVATKFGSHPDLITTQNTIRRIGTIAAMDYLLTGQSLSPQLAAKKGIIDACVPVASLAEAAKTLLHKKPQLQRAGLPQQLSALLPARWLTGISLHKKARLIGSAENYPAPYALINLWQEYGMSATAAAHDAYAESITALSQTPQAKNLTQVARLEQRLRYADAIREQKPLKHIHLIGSGRIAGDIATYLLIKGLNISLQDKQAEAINQTVEGIKQNLAAHYAYRAEQITTMLTNLMPDQAGKMTQEADLVLVMRGSNLADTQEIFAALEENARPDAILAVHSTTLALEKITAALLNPQRLIGIHFCYPAFKRELAEVSLNATTDAALLKQTLQALHQLGKIPLVMKNSPGLLVDRVLVQYIIQGIRLNQQGVPQTIIDSAGRDSGMPDGPLELADKLGLDYCLRVAEVLERTYQINIPYQLIDMVKTGKLGIKSGTGFYRYRNGNRLKPDRVEWDGSRQALKEKLTSQIYEEAALCLEEGLIEDPDLIDAGVIFGTGLAPYKGGPLYQQRNHNKRPTRA